MELYLFKLENIKEFKSTLKPEQRCCFSTVIQQRDVYFILTKSSALSKSILRQAQELNTPVQALL